eukprot:COSAG01_NODE_451_length_16883_cov_55.881733_13_plen_135_part_00
MQQDDDGDGVASDASEEEDADVAMEKESAQALWIESLHKQREQMQRGKWYGYARTRQLQRAWARPKSGCVLAAATPQLGVCSDGAPFPPFADTKPVQCARTTDHVQEMNLYPTIHFHVPTFMCKSDCDHSSGAC